MSVRKLSEKYLNLQPEKTKRFIWTFYAVGVAGFMIPFTQEIFIALISWALLMSFFLLMWFHQGGFSARTILVFAFIFLAGYFVEVAGVATGIIFGNYTYGGGLGIKVFDTPLLIGINWLMLSYATASIMQPLKVHGITKALLAATAMVVYDIVMEQTAPMLHMWFWKDGVIPLENYVAWFLLSLLFQAVLLSFRIRLKNALALTLFSSLFIFSLVLAIYNYLVT